MFAKTLIAVIALLASANAQTITRTGPFDIKTGSKLTLTSHIDATKTCDVVSDCRSAFTTPPFPGNLACCSPKRTEKWTVTKDKSGQYYLQNSKGEYLCIANAELKAIWGTFSIPTSAPKTGCYLLTQKYKSPSKCLFKASKLSNLEIGLTIKCQGSTRYVGVNIANKAGKDGEYPLVDYWLTPPNNGNTFKATVIPPKKKKSSHKHY